MHWYVSLSCTLVTFLCTDVLSQNSFTERKQSIVNKGYDMTAQIVQLVYKGNNVLLSPFNIRSALSLVHLGANDNTRDEIAHLLGLPTNLKDIQQAHEIMSQILREIENTTEVPVYRENEWKTEKGITINNANGIFVQEGVKLLPPYKSQVQSYYKGEAINVDFAKQNAKATDTINQFISKNTNGRIPKLFPAPLDPQLLIVLAACLYFKAGWDDPFIDYNTKEAPFYTGSSNISVKLMQKVDDIPYINVRSLKAEAIGLSYTADDASMFVILPYPNQTLDAVVSSLTGDILKQIVQKSTPTYVDMKIPKTKYKWSEDINEPLQKLGVIEVFGSNAKLNNVADVALTVSKVTHAAEIEINEKGTEASAVTVVQATYSSAFNRPKPTPILFHVNRPFCMFIHHRKTETILFVGTVHNPNGSS